MTIETKYELGQEVHFMYKNQIHKLPILNIKTFHSSLYPEGKITYTFNGSDVMGIEEKDCFQTRNDLINAL